MFKAWSLSGPALWKSRGAPLLIFRQIFSLLCWLHGELPALCLCGKLMEPSCPLGGKGTKTFHQQAASAPRGGVCPGTNLPDGKRECGPAASKGSQPRTQGTGLPLWTRVPFSEWETLGLVIPLSGLVCAARKLHLQSLLGSVIAQSQRLTTRASELSHLTLRLFYVLTSL